MLVRAGHEVTVVTGTGRATGEEYKVVVLSDLAPDDKLNAAVRGTLERGATDNQFGKYRDRLVKVVGKALAPMDLTIAHKRFHHARQPGADRCAARTGREAPADRLDPRPWRRPKATRSCPIRQRRRGT